MTMHIIQLKLNQFLIPFKLILKINRKQLYFSLIFFLEQGTLWMSLQSIYPAREEPIIGVTSQILLEKINCSKKELIDSKSIENIVLNSKIEVISILGAGNVSENLNKEIFQNV